MLCYRKKIKLAIAKGSYGKKISLSILFTYNVKLKRRSVRDNLFLIFFHNYFVLIDYDNFLYISNKIKAMELSFLRKKTLKKKGGGGESAEKIPAGINWIILPSHSQSYSMVRLLCTYSFLCSKLAELRSWTLLLIISNVTREFCCFHSSLFLSNKFYLPSPKEKKNSKFLTQLNYLIYFEVNTESW